MRLHCTYALALVTLAVAGCSDPAAVGKQNQQSGNAIIKALEAYKSSSGSYPPTLEELVPHFLPAIPPARDARWSYTLKGDAFELGFTGGGDSDHAGWYDSASKSWWIDTK